MSSEESPYVNHYVEQEIKEEDGHGSMDDKGNLTLVAKCREVCCRCRLK